MKKILITITIALTASFAFAETKVEPTKPKTKEVCKTDKAGKKTCKTIKVRKKLDGKPIPTKS